MFDTAPKRVIYRLIEIFLISGAIAVLSSDSFMALVPAAATGVVAAITKMLREIKKSRIEKRGFQAPTENEE